MTHVMFNIVIIKVMLATFVTAVGAPIRNPNLLKTHRRGQPVELVRVKDYK